MAKKKIEPEEVKEEEVTEQVEPEVQVTDPITLKANQIMEYITGGVMYENLQLDPTNANHLLVAAWVVGRGGWLRR